MAVRPRLSDRFLGSQSDERLVALARAGHERAFVLIVERYRRELLAFARGLGPQSRAEDVVQQALVSALVAVRAGVEVDHVRGWLHQIVRNAAIKTAVRVPSESELGDDLVAAETLEQEVERRRLARSVLAEVARLPDRQRDALLGMAVEGRSRGEVALSMGLSEGAVRQLVHRARTRVRAVVTAITPYPLASWAAGGHPASDSARIAEVTFGAGSASVGGITLKAGAVVVATGVLATGIVVSHHSGQRVHRYRQSRPPAGLTARGAQTPRVGGAAGPAHVDAALTVPQTEITDLGHSQRRGHTAASVSNRGSGSSSSTAASPGGWVAVRSRGGSVVRSGSGSGDGGGSDSARSGSAASAASSSDRRETSSPRDRSREGQKNPGPGHHGDGASAGGSSSSDGNATTTTTPALTDSADTPAPILPSTTSAGQDTTPSASGD